MSSQPQGSNPESAHNESSDLTFSSDSVERAGRPLNQQQLEHLERGRPPSSESQGPEAAFQWPTPPLGAPSTSPDETEVADPRNDVEQSCEADPNEVDLETADADPSLASMARQPQQSLFTSPPATGDGSSGFDDNAPTAAPPAKLTRSWTSADTSQLAPERPGIKRSSTTWTHRPATPEAELGMSHISFLPAALAQTVQIPLNLLRSLIPHPLLESPAPESLSASAMQVPVASLGALLEACQALDWVSKRTLNLVGDTLGESVLTRRSSVGGGKSPYDMPLTNRDFDLAAMMQKVADLVGGIAAAKGVDLVIGLQPDAKAASDSASLDSMLECCIWSEPDATKFLFMSCLANVIQSAAPHSTLEIDFNLQRLEGTVPKQDGQPEVPLVRSTVSFTLTPPMEADIDDEQRDALKDEFIAALVDNVGGSLQTEFRSAIRTTGPAMPVPRATTSLRHEISISGGQGAPPPSPSMADTDDQARQSVSAPTTQELLDFAKDLSGHKVAFHAQRNSPFASQLTGLLSTLGCQVSYVGLNTQNLGSPGESEGLPGPQVKTAVALTNGRPALVSYKSDLDDIGASSGAANAGGRGSLQSETPLPDDTAVLDPVTGVPVTFVNRLPAAFRATASDAQSGPNSSGRPSISEGPPISRVEPFNFVIIDDDIVTLQRELLRLRSAVPMLRSSLNASRQASRPSRPALDHRTKSSPQVERVKAQHPMSVPSLGSVAASMGSNEESVSQVIIFFTSLRSYRLVRDTVQPIIDSASFSGGAPPPEVMVLPKPAGLRRILTALYAAEHKPMVDAPFLPIATSPISPSFVRGRSSWWDSDGAGNGNLMTLARQQSDLQSPSNLWSPAPSFRSGELDSTPFLDAHLEDAVPAGRESETPDPGGSGRNLSQGTALPSEQLGSKLETVPRDSRSGTRSSSSAPGTASRSTKTEADSSRPAPASTSVSAPGSNASNHTARFQKSSLPHSPLPPDALEYFSETAAKMGGSGASGMVIQSPDGRPAGIFFQPKSSSSVSSYGASTPGSFRRTNSSTKPASLSGGAHVSKAGSEASVSGRAAGQKDGLPRSMSAGISGLSRMTGEADVSSGAATTRPRAATSRSSKSSGLIDSTQSSASSSRYPAGSIFAPQVGIQSVLSGSRPPMATPLNSNSSVVPGGSGTTDVQWTPGLAKTSADMASGTDRQEAAAAPPPSRQARKPSTTTKSETSAKSGTSKRSPATKQAAPSPVSTTGTPPRKKIVKSSSSKGGPPALKVAQATPPAKASSRSDVSAPASPVVGTGANGGASRTVANKLMARQTFAAATSPADTKRPSAQPQSGFMIGMGFAPTARRGTGPKKAPVREAVLPPIKVLIVEDNPINQRILSMFMSRQKIKYDVATNGREAVEKWQTGGFHLILMDIQLPVMDGIEATKEIRKLERSANIGILPNTPPASSVHSGSTASSGSSRKGLVPAPLNPSPFRAQVIIVALTASVLSSDRVEALAAGCNDFLNKPVSLPWLNQKILEWGSMMYLMYSGLSDEGSTALHQKDAASKAQVHLGFGYGPAEKAKALASNLHIGAGLGKKKKKPIESAPATATAAAAAAAADAESKPRAEGEPVPNASDARAPSAAALAAGVDDGTGVTAAAPEVAEAMQQQQQEQRAAAQPTSPSARPASPSDRTTPPPDPHEPVEPAPV
ncbi:uncharacterized protein PFL1_00558 [Pseudozyma flocculosa PF-1]|uniref:uncharacterized protein n=1 Tax=Pseudozyma flocculosa PF-1 TaxID=1277687 RepID=UPI0004561B5B|nr:uncharacterized protein PFL1_00558 [Pseudozyma flocculosa PF-1]EPQ32362.1 hypothetical protein PFL1_00558 [Pseudozyma flocculosa PF-1]